MAKISAPPINSYYLVDDKAYRIKRTSVGTDQLWARELNSGQVIETRYAVFVAAARRILSIGELATLLNRTNRAIQIYEQRGIIRPGLRFSNKNGKEWRFYTLEQALEIRDDLATIHIGRPRKNNTITNNMTIDKGNLLLILRERYGYRR